MNAHPTPLNPPLHLYIDASLPNGYLDEDSFGHLAELLGKHGVIRRREIGDHTLMRRPGTDPAFLQMVRDVRYSESEVIVVAASESAHLQDLITCALADEKMLFVLCASGHESLLPRLPVTPRTRVCVYSALADIEQEFRAFLGAAEPALSV